MPRLEFGNFTQQKSRLTTKKLTYENGNFYFTAYTNCTKHFKNRVPNSFQKNVKYTINSVKYNECFKTFT